MNNCLDETVSAARRTNRSKSGMTLVEIMVSVFIFSIAAGAVLAAFLMTRKIAVSNLSESFAQITAQSIIEQIIRIPPTVLADSAQSSVEIKLPTLTSTNRTSMPSYSLPWASASTDYTSIGSTNGILVDAAYIAASNTIHPERYMKMKVNLQRTIENSENRVRIVLRYQWEIPDRKKTDGTSIYLTGQITTIRSMALRF